MLFLVDILFFISLLVQIGIYIYVRWFLHYGKDPEPYVKLIETGFWILQFWYGLSGENLYAYELGKIDLEDPRKSLGTL